MADRLSRSYDRSDHRLNPAIFELVRSWLGQDFTLDACANGSNRQVKRFYARDPDQLRVAGCLGVNVFAHDVAWQPESRVSGPLRSEFVYCNPPWSLIAPLWSHFRECGAAGALIFPDMPRAPWFGPIFSESVSVRRVAWKGQGSIFFQPSLEYKEAVGPVPWDVWCAHFDFRAL